MIVVLDTSSLVSAALMPNSIPEQALLAVIEPPCQVIISQEVEDEYRAVLFRPKFDRFASIQRREFALEIILFNALMLTISEHVRECRDPKDDKYLSLAASGAADVIISSDDDLLTLHPWRGIPIVKPADFLTGSSLKLS